MNPTLQYIRFQLEEQLYRKFNLNAALTLSDMIHELEAKEIEIPEEIDRLWYKLTVKIESQK